MSILDVNVCFLDPVFAHILLECAFAGWAKLGPLVLRDTHEHCLFPINWLVVFVYVFSLSDLLARNYSFLVVFFFFFFWLFSLGWSFLFISMCKAGFVDIT